ncbi:MAG: STT3 domain-containing protein [Candidatus Aquicultorales bacterium]
MEQAIYGDPEKQSKEAVPSLFKRIKIPALYVLLIALALYGRTFFIPGAFWDPHGMVQEPDTARVFRLVDLIANDYPSLPLSDPFANFPWGIRQQLPPLWAFFLASFALAVQKITAVPIASAASLLPPIMGLLAAIPTYVSGRCLFGRRTGHAAVAMLFFFPLSMVVSGLSMVDHHVADVFLYSTTIALVLAAHSHLKGNNLPKSTLFSVCAGLTTAVTLLVSISSILSIAVFAVAFFASAVALPTDERRRAARVAVITLTASIALLVSLFLITHWFSRTLSFSELSLLQPLVLVGVLLAVIVSHLVNIRFEGRRFRAPALVLTYLGLALVTLSIAGLREQLLSGFYRSVASYPLALDTIQLQPFIGRGWDRLLLVFLALSIGCAAWAWSESRKDRLDFGLFFFLTWFLISGFYFSAAVYYLMFFMPVVVIFLGWLITKLGDFSGKLASVLAGAKYQSTTDMTVWAAALVLTSIAFLSIVKVWQMEPQLSRGAMLSWIETNTPKAADFLDIDSSPEYGILTWWSKGEIVELLAKRPVLATGNQETGLKGIILSHRIFQAPSEREAVKLLRQHRLRYVLLSQEHPPWIGDLDKMGVSSPEPYTVAHPAEPSEISDKERASLMSARLYRFRGVGNEKRGIAPLEHFRLVNATGIKDGQPLLLFEVVEGATLSIKASPGTNVSVSTAIRLGDVRLADWVATRTVSTAGLARISLPYETDSRYPVHADDYRVTIDGARYDLEVPEQAVLDGSEVSLGMGL